MDGLLGRRTEPRVGFRRDVRVTWSGDLNGVVARAVNLSPAGILVDAPTPTVCPVGSSVLCDVALAGGELRIHGRVAHTRVLSPAKVGMGIAFVDLSPWVAAELYKVIDESDEKTQPIKLRFAGTSQTLSTRALPTADGFRFTTALPFLRPETEVDITLSPDATVGTKGRVAAVALDRGEDGVPSLVIDVRAENAPFPPALDSPSSEGAEAEAGALPDRIWEARDFNAPNETRPGHQPMVAGEIAPSDAPEAAVSPAVAEPSPEVPGPWGPDETENVRLQDLLPRQERPRASALAVVAWALAAVAVATALWMVWSRASATRRLSIPLISALRSPPSEAPAQPPAARPPTIEPIAAPVAEPIAKPIAKPIVEPIAKPIVEPIVAAPPAPPSEEPSSFKVGLAGSLAGAQRYPLRAPDGIAFNLPKARATTAHGTYTPAIRGLRAVWVRGLPGGGTHLRFYYTKSRPSPEVVLQGDGVLVQEQR
jgi:hypothetical protein